MRPTAMLRHAPAVLAVAAPLAWAASHGHWAPLAMAAAKTLEVLVAFHLAVVLVVRLTARRPSPTPRRAVRVPVPTRPRTVTRPAPIPVTVTVLDRGRPRRSGRQPLNPEHRPRAPVTDIDRGIGQDGSITRPPRNKVRGQR